MFDSGLKRTHWLNAGSLHGLAGTDIECSLVQRALNFPAFEVSVRETGLAVAANVVSGENFSIHGVNNDGNAQNVDPDDLPVQ